MGVWYFLVYEETHIVVMAHTKIQFHDLRLVARGGGDQLRVQGSIVRRRPWPAIVSSLTESKLVLFADLSCSKNGNYCCRLGWRAFSLLFPGILRAVTLPSHSYRFGWCTVVGLANSFLSPVTVWFGLGYKQLKFGPGVACTWKFLSRDLVVVVVVSGSYGARCLVSGADEMEGLSPVTSGSAPTTASLATTS